MARIDAPAADVDLVICFKKYKNKYSAKIKKETRCGSYKQQVEGLDPKIKQMKVQIL